MALNEVLPPDRAMRDSELRALRHHHRVSDAYIDTSPDGEQLVKVEIGDTTHCLHWMLHEGWDTWEDHE